MKVLQSIEEVASERAFGLKRQTNSLLFGLLIVLNVAIPKAGFKVGDVPITFGCIYAIALGIIYFPRGIAQFMRSGRGSACILAYCLWIFMFLSLCGFFMGIENPGFYLSMIFGFFILPVAFMVSFSQDDAYPRALETYLLWSVRFAVLYGIFLFLFKLKTGKFIEIPYLTVNADDVGRIGEKYIQRTENVFKLISTYNNGNIFGVCLLMILPLYDMLERRLGFRILARCALLLTLSRTVWVALMLYEMFLVRRPLWQRVAMLLAGAIGIFLMLRLIGASGDFLTDSTLGGRMAVVDQLRVSMFPLVKFDYVSEILWVSVAYFGGVIGVVTFAGLFALIFLIFQASRSRGPYLRAATIGVVNFICCSFSDAAANYIPTMFIFWLVVRVGLISAGGNEEWTRSSLMAAGWGCMESDGLRLKSQRTSGYPRRSSAETRRHRSIGSI